MALCVCIELSTLDRALTLQSVHESIESHRAGMKKEHVSENSIMIYDDVMYPDNVTYEHIGEISIS